MNIGSFNIELLSEGVFEFFADGHINRLSSVEESGGFLGTSKRVGINPVLIETSNRNILLDAGLGWGLDAGSGYENVSNVVTNLAIFQLHPDDITDVVLTHLHYDHAAGCSYINSENQTVSTFPNATYHVHKREWEFAISHAGDSAHGNSSYNLDEFYRLFSDDRVQLLEGDSTNICEGVTAICSGGHTAGHQLVHVTNQGETALFMGDLLPSSSHLNHYSMENVDEDPLEAKKQKVQWLRNVHKEQIMLLFYHGISGQYGRIIKDEDEQYLLMETK